MRGTDIRSYRWRIVALIYATALLYLLFQGGKTAVMLFMILNLLILYLLLGRWSGIAGVTGVRRFTSAAPAEQSLSSGSSLEVHLQLKVPGYYPIPYVLVRDELIKHNGQRLVFEASFVPSWKRAGEVVYTTPPLGRGEYRFHQAECLTKDIFGLFEHAGQFVSEATFAVLPQTIQLRQWHGIQRGIRGPYSHAAASRSSKETTQINGVREYLYGDRLSRVHWNATAKTGEWKSKAFERESLPRTIVILDRNHRAYLGGAGDSFEVAVAAAASLFENGLRGETAMGLLSAGARTTALPPRSGSEQRNAVMNHLTRVDADADKSIFKSLQVTDSLMEAGSFVVLITAEGGSEVIRSMEWLARKGMMPCLLQIGGKWSDQASQRMIRGRGWPVFSIKQLHELPAALEGGGL
ncbi:DUF58 domain-containing protein [Paenibacillus sp. GCM10023252]|uniref:DUF58 domain-containing protein n=1 Tax=Paenibacillus sp. GCM10023252 TaxID=3252649 RepID=UPI003609C1FC